MDSFLEAEEALRALGFDVTRGRQLSERLFHGGEAPARLPLEPVRDPRDSSFLKKPARALWTSPGRETSRGEVTTAWGEWMAAEAYGLPFKSLQEVFLAPEALILTLTEETYLQLPLFFGASAEPLSPLEGFALFSSSDETFSLSWEALAARGVGAVRVDGSRERQRLYGWDVPSVVILRPEAVVALKDVQAASPQEGPFW